MGGSGSNFFVMMALMIGIFYFMLIRPQQRKERERKLMIQNLKVGARVMFGGGLIGSIAEVKEYTFLIEIASGVKMEIARGAVTKILTEGEKVALEER